jgi:hypothetical protein
MLLEQRITSCGGEEESEELARTFDVMFQVTDLFQHFQDCNCVGNSAVSIRKGEPFTRVQSFCQSKWRQFTLRSLNG